MFGILYIMTYYTHLDSPIGTLLLISDGKVLRGLYFTVYKHVPKIAEGWVENKEMFRNVIAQLNEYFAGSRKSFDIPMQVNGTEFQKSVWEHIAKIPYGQHISYKDIAEAIGKPKAVRAVGTAVGNNPICIIGPCHRVLTASGQIGGYAGGSESKEYLLQLETTAN